MSLYVLLGLAFVALAYTFLAKRKNFGAQTDELDKPTILIDSVDPIAEADVYLAYGRNEQAKNILKEALAKQPDRKDIEQKLKMLK